MLRNRRLSTATTEKLWTIGLRIRQGSEGTTSKFYRRQTSALVSQYSVRPSWDTIIQCRSFTSGKEQSTPSVLSPKSTVPLDNVLISAAKEAQRLSDLAAKARPEKDDVQERDKRDVDDKTMRNALDASQALLFVTRLSPPLKDAIRNRQTASPEIQKQISSLHRAFLIVTSWCLDVVTISIQPDPRMLDTALQVARRAHQLQLPLHLPLYVRLMQAVADHYDPNGRRPAGRKYKTSAGALILEIADRATTMLGPEAIAASQFFRDPLQALARRRCLGDVATVLRGMETQFRGLELDKITLLKLLIILEIILREGEGDTTNWEATEEILDILNLADPYLWKPFTALTSLTAIMNRKRGSMEQIQKNLTESSAGKPTTEELLPTLPSHLAERAQEPRRVRRKRSTESYQKKDDLYLFRGWIYQSESPSGHNVLPDITAQIEALYPGKDFRYSEELERSILERHMMEEDEDEELDQMNDELLVFEVDGDGDNDDFFSDDDDLFDMSDDDDDDDDDSDSERRR